MFTSRAHVAFPCGGLQLPMEALIGVLSSQVYTDIRRPTPWRYVCVGVRVSVVLGQPLLFPPEKSNIACVDVCLCVRACFFSQVSALVDLGNQVEERAAE